MENLFQSMFEAPDDPPEVSQVDETPAVEETPSSQDDTPPTVDSTMDDTPDMMSDQQYDTGMDQSTQQPEEDNTTLDEKGEIFAKVSILKEYRSLYSKIEDTLTMIDKIDLVQTGNNIKTSDISEIKDGLSELMTDVYTTIVYEFQLQYKNLKVKMVEYSSRYVILVKTLVTLIKNDQKSTRS